MKQIEYDEIKNKVRGLVTELFNYKNVSIGLNETDVYENKHSIVVDIVIKDPVPEGICIDSKDQPASIPDNITLPYKVVETHMVGDTDGDIH